MFGLKPSEKKKLIKNYIKNCLMIFAFPFAIILIYSFDTGKFQLTLSLIMFLLVLFVVSMGTFLGLKYRKEIHKGKFSKFYVILGTLMILFNGILLFIEKNKILYLIQIVVGVGLIQLGRTKKSILLKDS
jgi:cation transport ATPase